MARGKQTPPKKVEEAVAKAVLLGNKSEAGRQVGLAESTVRSLLNNEKFDEYREQVQKEYILKTWQNILAIESALVKKIEVLDPNTVQLRELTGALKDLKSTVENVISNINVEKAVFVMKWGDDERS